MLQNEEFIPSFVEEARSHIENLEAGLLGLDLEKSDPEEINNMFRAVHSIKGTAGFFNLTKIVELSHQMENIMGECRNGSLAINSNMVDILLSSNDCLKSMIEDVMNSENMDIAAYKAALDSILQGGSEDSGTKREQAAADAPSLAGSSGQSIELDPSANQAVSHGVEQGKKLYRISMGLNADFGSKGENPVDFFAGIASIGEIVELKAVIDQKNEGSSSSGEDIILNCTFLSILDKNFLPDAIGVPENEITELEVHAAAEKPQHSQQKKNSADISKGDEPAALGEKKADGGTAAGKGIKQGGEDSIRVNVTLLNNLLNLASEMVLGRNQLLRAMEHYRKGIPGIEPILQNIDHITTDLQGTVMQTRMQPIANVFNKFPRIIRDLSKKMGKDMELQLEGVDVELDKSIIESLGDPLTHLVRNAADHGLEPPEEREEKGKPRLGAITLKAYHEGGCVNIDVIDDGKGIDIERIKQKAYEKGLIDGSEKEILAEQEVLQLLFRPGFSTAEKVTDVSGRGVGMDVVKTNIEKLGGTIEIFSTVGKGTVFRLVLPLTLAIIPSIIVEVEKQKFALPQVNLQEIVRIKPGDTSRRIEYIHNSEVLRLRGKLLPIVHLADVLGLQRTYQDPFTGERKLERRKTLYDQRRKDVYVPSADSDPESDFSCQRMDNTSIIRILVVKIGSRRFGMAVDLIHESEEILVKQLPRFVSESKCYSGVTIMGDGKIAMILDPEGIIQKASLRFVESVEAVDERDLEASYESMREQLNMLIFKCSGPEYFGMDLSLVSRVEEINPEAIDRIGDKEFIKYRGSSLRVIRPEHFLSVNSQKNEAGKLYVIIPKLIKHPIGILVEKIHDTVQVNVQLDQESIKDKGLLGSFICGNKIVLLVNIYELFELADPDKYQIASSCTAGKNVRALVVEDTPFFLKMELSYLQSAGFNVLTATNGKEALQVLQDNEVDIVVSDIDMPLMNGLELVKRIRSDKRLSRLPVIAVTSLTAEKQVKEGMEAGFDFYEFKLDRTSLLEKVELALQKKEETV